jgi:uncharacterized RDD family membrane protein YckC
MACWTYEGVLLFGVVFMASLVYTVLAQGVKSLLGNTGTEHLEAASDLELSMLGASSSALPTSLERELLQLFILSVLVAYFVFFWRKGQTLAMKTWGLRLTTQSGSILSTPRALFRLVLCWVWFWPLLLPFEMPWIERSGVAMVWIAIWAWLSAFHPQHQFWHDAWAGTQLIVEPKAKDDKAT